MNWSIQELINQSVSEQKEHKERTSWHATDMGKCLRGIYLSRTGIKPKNLPDTRTYRVFKCGHLFEQFIVDTIDEKAKRDGLIIEKQKRIEIPELDMTGYADLVVGKDNEQLVYDVKSVNSKKFWWMEKMHEGADEHYRQQVWVYLKALNIQEGRILYVSKDDLTLAEYKVFLEDEKLTQMVMEQINILNKCWKEQILPEPAPAIIEEYGKRKINFKARYCSYHDICLNDPDWLKKAEQELRIDKKVVSISNKFIKKIKI